MAAPTARSYDRSAISDALKVEYEPALQKAFAERTYDITKITTAMNKAIRGGYLHIETETDRMPGGSFGGEKTPYPYPSDPALSHFKVRPAWLRGTGEFTKQAEDDSKESRLAWIQAQRGGMDRLVSALARQSYRQVFGDRYARVALVSDDLNAGTTVNLVHADILPNAADAWSSPLSDRGSRALLIGELIEFISIDDATGVGTTRVDAGGTNTLFEIISITNHYQIVVHTAPIGLDGTEAVCVAEAFNKGVADTDDQPYAPYGLNEIIFDGVDDGAPTFLFGHYGEMDRSTYPQFNSLCVNKAGVSLAETDFNNMSNALYGRSGKKLQDGEYVCVVSPDVFAKIKSWNELAIRYEPRTSPLGMPDDAVTWAGMGKPLSFMIDWMCPARTMYFVHKPSMHRYENMPLEFVNEDGSILRPVLSSGRLTDVWQYHPRQRYQIFSPAPHRMGRIDNIGFTDPNWGLASYLPSI